MANEMNYKTISRLEELDEMANNLNAMFERGEITEEAYDFELEGIALSRAQVTNKPF